jgi:hypothetical protein
MKLNHFIKENGKTNSMRTRESYVKKHFPELHLSIINHIKLYRIRTNSFSESMYYFFNDIKETVKCELCNEPTRYIGLIEGFSKYCSYKCSNSSEDVKNKKKETIVKKYGVENPFQSESIKNKIENTLKSRYGETNPMRVKSIKNKMINNRLKNEGVKWSSSRGGKSYNTRIKKERENFESFLKNINIIKYNPSKNSICNFKCNKCGGEFNASKYLIYQRYKLNIEQCILCNPIGSFNDSCIEKEIKEWLDSINIKYIESDRKILNGKELDIYIKDKNMAIEINGIYWHSELFKDANYHLNKTEECEKKGVQLIHIFEDEWNYNKDIVKSRLKSILGIIDNKIYARKCKVIELDSKTSKDFLNDNHIQGNITASVRLGLEYNGKLVSIMTLGKLRKALGSTGKCGEFELYRFSNLCDTSVIGGASKLLKYFINKWNPIKIVSYADRRWSTGKLYKYIGFNLIKKTEPNWWYFKNGIRYHRFNFRKSELVKQGFDINKTEHEIMLERKMYRLYDSGNLRFEMLINK